MPEGHTIHRIAKDHWRDFGAESLAISSPQGRFDEGAAKLSGRTLEDVEAHGKHLCYVFSGRKRLHVHLGLYGKFRRHPAPPPDPRGAVRLRMVGASRAVDLNGPTRCELWTKKQWQELQSRLGPDPLREDAEPEQAWARIRRSRQAIGKLLMDQSVVAGVGNVYRAEVLFLLGIHPERPGNQITQEEFDELWTLLVDLLQLGVRYNRIVIADPQDVGKPRSRMSREERLLIYKHKLCTKCDGPIRWWDLGARRAYACERCQK